MNDTAIVKANAAASLALSELRFTDEQKRLILDTCCQGASAAEARALFAIAEARGMNPLRGECYFVKRWDASKQRESWAVQASIDSFRIKAEETGVYAGQDEPEFTYDKDGHLVSAKIRVYRKDWERPCVGVAYFSEYVQTTRDGKPTRFWSKMPHNQLAKCAESLALRKAFPAKFAQVYTPEEMSQDEKVMDEGAQAARDDGPPPESESSPDHVSQLLAALSAAKTDDECKAVGMKMRTAVKSGQIAAAQGKMLGEQIAAKRARIAKEVMTKPDTGPSPDDNDAAELLP